LLPETSRTLAVKGIGVTEFKAQAPWNSGVTPAIRIVFSFPRIDVHVSLRDSQQRKLRRIKEKVMKNLFVGNMSFQTTEAELNALFKPYGQVTRVHLVMDRETGRARGFAFVEMPNDEEAAKAIAALDGKELGGRNLKINEARPKAAGGGGGPRSSGGGGGGRGRERFSNEDYRESARQPREPRW
jgi:RNA recognition motif-containing protein